MTIIADTLQRSLPVNVRDLGGIAIDGGAVPAGLAIRADDLSIITADYARPWETHARMEPINATVSVTPERVDVWSPTQEASRLCSDALNKLA